VDTAAPMPNAFLATSATSPVPTTVNASQTPQPTARRTAFPTGRANARTTPNAVTRDHHATMRILDSVNSRLKTLLCAAH